MTPDLFHVDVSQAFDLVGGPALRDLDGLVARGRQVHDDLLLARARGQVGFADLYMLGREAMRAREAAESLASRFDNVAVLATGAEADVAGAILGALAHPFHNLLPAPGRAGRPRVFLVDSADPDRLAAFLESFAVEQTLLVTLAKSGDELAQLVQFGVARDVAKKRVGPGFQDHLVVVTDPKGGTLREEALREGLLSFEVPGNVPARYSALTPIGLLPAAIAGVDVRGVLGGAHGAAERTAGEDLRTNPAYQLAGTLHALAVSGRRKHLFVAASESLGATAVQAARLFEESVGAAPRELPAKRTCDAAVLPRSGASLVRRCAANREDTAVVIFELQRPARDRAVPKDAPGIPWLGGRQLSEYSTADAAAFRAVLLEAGVPAVTVRIPNLGASSVGALHMACMISAAFAGGLAGGEPFAGVTRDARDRALETAMRAVPAS